MRDKTRDQILERFTEQIKGLIKNLLEIWRSSCWRNGHAGGQIFIFGVPCSLPPAWRSHSRWSNKVPLQLPPL